MFNKFTIIFILFIGVHFNVFGNSFALEPNQIIVDGKIVNSLPEIGNFIKHGSRIYLGPGKYEQGIVIEHNDVVLSARGAHFVSAVEQGKATFVVRGENTIIEDVECSGVSVRHGNGACVRQEGKNLTLNNVYFHNSQQGVLQSGGSGDLTIKNSRFESLGFNGRAHAVYANGVNLTIVNSEFTDSKNQGHAIKSRSRKTRVINSIISSGKGDDSRLFDISDGGELEIIDSVLYQGKSTVNSQLIGFALEDIGRQRVQSITIKGSVILAERERGNIFLGVRKALPLKHFIIEDNLFIGRFSDEAQLSELKNYVFESREQIGLRDDAFPTLALLRAAKLGLFDD